VMRSFEIGAIGGCMLVEDTKEHRDIFGGDEEAVVYFRTAQEAAVRAHSLIADDAKRARLTSAVRTRIVNGGHSYRDRVIAMLGVVNGIHRKQPPRGCTSPGVTANRTCDRPQANRRLSTDDTSMRASIEC
jgi:spore maturation protein CgeB